MAFCGPAGTALSGAEGCANTSYAPSPCGRRARPGGVAAGLSHHPSQRQSQQHVQQQQQTVQHGRWRPAARPSRRRRAWTVADAAATSEGQQLLGGVTAPVARQLRIPVGDREVGVQSG